MSRVVKNNKLWLIPLCLVIAGVISMYGWQQLNAQDQPTDAFGNPIAPGAPGAPGGIPAAGGITGAPGAPGAPGVAGTAPAAAVPEAAPTFSLKSVLPPGVKTMKIKNWDGTAIEMLRFKYKTMDKRVITVHLPAVYKKEQKSKAGWDTLFRAFSMDQEAQLAMIEANKPPEVGPYMKELMSEIKGETPGAGFNQFETARALARRSIPSTAVQLPPMPTALPSMGLF